MSVYLLKGSRIFLKNPADYAKVAEKIRAREPIVIRVTTDGSRRKRRYGIRMIQCGYKCRGPMCHRSRPYC
jgi:hypothetical protein